MRKLRLRELKYLVGDNAASSCQSWDLRKHRFCFKGNYTLLNIRSHSQQVYAKIMASKPRSA